MSKNKFLSFVHKIFRSHVTWRPLVMIAYLSITIILILYMKISYNIYNDFYCIKNFMVYGNTDIRKKLFKMDNLWHLNYEDFVKDPHVIIKHYNFPYDPYFEKIDNYDDFINFMLFGNFIRYGGRKRTVSIYYKDKNERFWTTSYFVGPCLNFSHIAGMELNSEQFNEQTINY